MPITRGRYDEIATDVMECYVMPNPLDTAEGFVRDNYEGGRFNFDPPISESGIPSLKELREAGTTKLFLEQDEEEEFQWDELWDALLDAWAEQVMKVDESIPEAILIVEEDGGD